MCAFEVCNSEGGGSEGMVGENSGKVAEGDVAGVEVGEVGGADGKLVLSEHVEGCEPGGRERARGTGE